MSSIQRAFRVSLLVNLKSLFKFDSNAKIYMTLLITHFEAKWNFSKLSVMKTTLNSYIELSLNCFSILSVEKWHQTIVLLSGKE